MRVIIELKQADADGRGGDILTSMGMKRSEVSPNHFRAMMLSEPDDPHWDDRDLALPYIEALRDELITPRRVAVKTRSIPYNLMSSSAKVSAGDEDPERAHREARIKADWTKVAKEDVKVEMISGTFYGFGSELAVLRLFAHYNKVVRNKKTRAEYSSNRKTWYFALDTSL